MTLASRRARDRAERPARPRLLTSRGGFSLFELMVVLIILAVTSGLVATQMSGGWRSRGIREGTRAIAATMRALRERAIRRGVEQELVLEPDGQTYRWTDGRVATLPEGIAIIGVRGGWRDDDGTVRAIFYPNGGSTGLGVIIAAREDTGLRFSIEVDALLGSVVIEEVGGEAVRG